MSAKGGKKTEFHLHTHTCQTQWCHFPDCNGLLASCWFSVFDKQQNDELVSVPTNTLFALSLTAV